MGKKRGIIIIGIIIGIILLAGCYFFIIIGGPEIDEGKYKICDYDSYPDAYIEVKGNKVKFYNIDLNAIYRDYMLSTYDKMLDNGFESNMSDEEIAIESDLNEMFVNKGYEINYNVELKEDTFSYIYYCMGKDRLFGLVLEYNSLHKSIKINNPVVEIRFEKE